MREVAHGSEAVHRDGAAETRSAGCEVEEAGVERDAAGRGGGEDAGEVAKLGLEEDSRPGMSLRRQGHPWSAGDGEGPEERRRAREEEAPWPRRS